MFGSFKEVLRALTKSFKGVSRQFQGSFEGDSRKLKVCSSKIKGYFKYFKGIQGYLKEV